MRLLEIELSKERVLALPEPTRVLFISLGHITNEINALAKFAYWSASADYKTPAEKNGQEMNILLFLRLLAGKLNEAWQFYEKSFFGTKLSKLYEPKLDTKGSEALKFLKNYFGKSNAAHKLRNTVSFHYSPKDIESSLAELEGPLVVYLEKDSIPNNLFHYAEKLVNAAVISMTGLEQTDNPIAILSGEFFSVAANFVTLADNLMEAIIQGNQDDLRNREPKEIELNALVEFRKISIPWFSNTSNSKAT